MDDVGRDIIERCQHGDIRALETIYRLYGERVYRLCLRMMGDQSHAEDASQQIFVRVFEQISKFSGQSTFSTWLYRVATNHCLNVLKSRKPASSLSDLAESELAADSRPSPVDEAERSDEREYAASLLRSLDPDARSLIVLREIEMLTYQQIAYVLGIPVGTVMSRLHRVRQRLRAVVEEVQSGREAKRINGRDQLSKW